MADVGRTVTESGIRMIMDLASGRTEVVHLEVGEPSFDTPVHVREAAACAIAGGYTRYTENAGLRSLREVAAEKLCVRNGIRSDPDRVVVTAGGVAAVYQAVLALVRPGEQVLVPDPGWPNYAMMATLAGATPVPYPLAPEAGFVPDPEALRRLARASSATVLVVNSPANPTGAVWPESVHAAVLDVAAECGLAVVSDEVYDEIVFDGAHVSPAALDADALVVSVFSVSKTYAMTGWRIGYLDAPPAIARAIAKGQEAVLGCATAIAQKAAEAALSGPQDAVVEMVGSYRRRRDLVDRLLVELGLHVSRPSGAFYVMADVSAATSDSYAFARELLERRAVAVAPGEAFGSRGAGMVRISLAASERDLRTGIERLADAVAEGVS